MATWTTIPDADLTTGKPGKQYIFRALRDNIDAALSGDPSAPKVQSAAFADSVITASKLEDTIVGNAIVGDKSITVSTTNTAYTKLSEFFAARNGSIRISFNLRQGGGGTAYGRIYKNGVAIGTERITTSSVDVTYTEDFTGILNGDLIQLYLHSSAGTITAYSSSFLYKVGNPLEAAVTL